MLDKSIIDANKSVRDLALNFGIDFDKMKNGDKYEVLARFDDTNQESVVRFYKTINRGDRRVSIKGIKQYANIGDLIALSACLPKDDNKDIIIINVTRRADDE
jgi:molybdate-binding protein